MQENKKQPHSINLTTSITRSSDIKKEVLRSILVGVLSNLIDFLITGIIIYSTGSDSYDGFIGMILGRTVDGLAFVPPTSIYMFATLLGFVTAFFTNYILSVFYVFRYGHVGKRKRGVLLFVVFAILSVSITISGSALLHTVFKLNIWIVKIIMMLVVFVLNLFIRKRFIFNIETIRDDNAIYLPQNIDNSD